MLSLLIFIGEAVRDAFDPRKTFARCHADAALLSVRDLSVAFRQGGSDDASPSTASRFDIDKGETVALVGEIRLRQVGDRAVDPAAPALSGRPAIPTGEILFKGKDLLGAATASCARVRGNDITMVFQEPMTSLNPLHTIERQVGEILKLHQGLGDAAARTRDARAARRRSASATPRAGSAPIRTSSPAASASAS